MNSLSGRVSSSLMLLRRQWFLIFAVAVYILFTVSYMGPRVYDCGDTTSGISDNTAGPIWRNSLKPEQPILGGYENATNYPTGESLYSPVGYVALVQSSFTAVVSKVTTPVCAYNLYNILGYISTALVMFSFILYLTRSRWIALLGGYAVAFTPYVQSKIGGHPSYAYAALLIAILWLAVHLITYRKKQHAVMLGVLLAACAYFDPYFILFAITVALPVLAVWLLINIRKTKIKVKAPIKWREIKRGVAPFVLSIITFALLLTPLVAVRVINADHIESSVSGVRGNVKAAAMMCSNKPLDYILPDPDNIYMTAIFGSDYRAINIELRNWCGPGESRVSISLTVLLTLTIGGIVMLWERINKRTLGLRKILPYKPRLIIGSVIGVGAFAFLLGLPPYIRGIITPSGMVLEITEMWRIFAREQLLVNVALVILFAIVLKYFSSAISLKKHKKTVLGLAFTIIFLGIVLEYQISKPFNPPTFSYSEDVPQTYKEVRDNKEIRALAEYPIDRTGLEYDSMVYYQSMQVAHGKKLFNSAVATSQDARNQNSLKDLQDPQTLQALRAWGIEYVVIHGMKKEDIIKGMPDIQILHHSSPRQFALSVVRNDVDNDIVLARIPDGPSSKNIITIEEGYNLNLEHIQSPIGMEYLVAPKTTLRIVPINKNKPASSKACFEVKLTEGTKQAVVAIQLNGKEVQTINATDEYSLVRLDVHSGDKITVASSARQSMLINNLGCAK